MHLATMSASWQPLRYKPAYPSEHFLNIRLFDLIEMAMVSVITKIRFGSDALLNQSVVHTSFP
jgi:hypothetical protein